MRGKLTWALVASASMLPLAPAAMAQTADAEEEIIVTAQKREERLRDVPQSVTALTEQTLERIQANSFADYVGRVPGLTANNEGQPGTSRVVLRGIDTGQGHTASVGTYVDETPFGFSGGLGRGDSMAPDLDPFDIARVEVLRGPQGTLYGASTMGGLIRFVTQDPSTDGFEARIRATAETTEGGEESYAGRAVVNVPLGDQAALRVSGYHRSEGGYIDDVSRGVEDINSSETQGWRAKFLLNATENLTFRISAAQQDIHSDGSTSVNYLSGPFRPETGPYEQERNFSEPLDISYAVYNATIDWDLGWASLTSASSFTEFDRHQLSDTTVAVPVGVANYLDDAFSSDKWTQEIRLSSPTDEHFEWLLGYFYTNETGSLDQEVFLFTPPGTPIPFTAVTESEYTEHAIFGAATVYFTPTFDVNFGARYSQNEQHASILGGGVGAGLTNPGIDSDDASTTYSIAPRWRPNDNLMIYARVATGFRPGGPNVALTPGAPTSFDPDTLINYEFGVKADLVPDLLRVDVAAFLIDWEDIQLNITDGAISFNGNGGTARSQGIEWTATLTPLEGLAVTWTGAYTEAELTSNTDASATPVGLDGDRLPNAPDWTSSVDVAYEWAISGDASAYVGGAWRYIGERTTGFTSGSPPLELPSYDIIDLRAGVDFDRFGVQLFAKNVTDENTLTTFGGVGQTYPTTLTGSASIPRPRTIGVELTARF